MDPQNALGVTIAANGVDGSEDTCDLPKILSEEKSVISSSTFNVHLVQALYDSVKDSNKDMLTDLVTNHKLNINHVFMEPFIPLTERGNTPVHAFAQRGKVECLQLCIELGADVTLVNKKGETPLHLACKHGQFECVVVLLKCNASVKDVQDNRGLTPLIKAIFRYETVFMQPSYKKIVKLLLQYGVDVNIGPISGISPLHMAAEKWDSFLLQSLVEHGANVNAVCENGTSPLITVLSAKRLNTANVKILIESGANIDFRTRSGKTPLHIAVSKSDDISVESLLDAGADPNIEDNCGNTPLWIAVSENNTRIAPLLIAHGADINFCLKPRQLSLLSQAVITQSFEMAQLLLKSGAYVRTETVMGSTPLHFAVQAQDVALVKLLLYYNCELDIASNAEQSLNPKTPFQMAMELGNKLIIKLLCLAGATVRENWLTPNRLPQAIRENEDTLAWIYEFLFEPKSLMNLCRLRVRSILGKDLLSKVDKLLEDNMIPQRVGNAVLLKDILI
ncbi:hypothetical protein CHS0354_012640 [Potamilus streckersoni]|uniref:SOCS box domain-containing protein n=1 Tax=Potamilus streckersoni TaxID=2493646 RepID=A0AAE0W4B2_9BIVA|nr:hypothetical protein CHS0354_012640 [Potamilus streckersoni]